MTGMSMGAAQALAKKFPWGQYRTFIDVGCAQGCVPVQVALAHPHMSGGGFDLPVVGPIFECAWMREVGFHATYVEHLDGPDSMAVGIK